MIELFISMGILLIAYYLLVTMPVKNEMQKEKDLQSGKASTEPATSQALRDDYDHLFNTENDF